MHFKSIILCEYLVTLAALIWSFLSVNPQMDFKILIYCKSLLTLTTLLWSIPSVHSHIDFKLYYYFLRGVGGTLSHWLHCVLSLVCILIKILNFLWEGIALSHWLHYVLSSVCILIKILNFLCGRG